MTCAQFGRGLDFEISQSLIMRPSSLGGGRILRRTLSVCPSQRCYQDQGVRDQDHTKTRQAETETETKTREAETKTKT